MVRQSTMGTVEPLADRSAELLRVAVAAHLGRYSGQSRIHTESDLRVFLNWCARQAVDPLAAPRADVDGFVRWLQDDRQFKPSTVRDGCRS